MPEEDLPDASRSDSGRSRRLLKWGGGFLGGLVVLVLAAALILPRLFTSEQLKGYVVPPLEEATGRQVHIDAIGLRVLPAPTVRVSGFRLANAEGYGPAPAVEARALNVDVALWPLLLLNIRPTAVALEAPVVRYEVGEDGTTNFDDLGATDTTAAADGSPLAGIPVSSFRVSEAQMNYTDRSTGQALRLDFGAQLSARPDGPAITSEGTVDLRSVRALLPSVRPDTLAVQEAEATYSVRVMPSEGEVDVQTLQFNTAPVTVSTNGTISGVNTRPVLDLTFETGRTDLAEIAAFAPAAAVAGVNPQGTLALEGTVTGPLADTTESLTLSATGQLAEAGVDYEGTALLRDLSADLSLALDSVAVRSMDGRLLGASLTGDLSVRDLGDAPRLTLQLKTSAMDLADLAAFAPPEQIGRYNPQGTLRLDATARGPLPSDVASMQQLVIDGAGRLAGGGVDYEGEALLRDLQAGLGFSGTTASVRGLDGQLLGRPVSGAISVRDLFGQPQVEGQLAGTANLPRLASLAGDAATVGAIEGEADYDVQFEGPIDTPDAIQPQGSVRLADVQVPYESFRSPVEIPDATVQLTGTGLSMDRFSIRSGDQAASLRATVQDLFPLSAGMAETDPALSATFTLTADRLDLVSLYPEADTSSATYSQLFAAHLSGAKLDGQSPEAVAEELYGGVELPAYAVEGRVEVGTLLNDPQRFDALSFDVQMDDRRLRVQNLAGTTYEGTLAGSLTLDQRASASASTGPTSGSVWLAATAPGRVPSTTAPAPASALMYDFELRDAQAGAVLADWTTLGRFVTGTLTLDADGETALTDGFLPRAEAFTAIGQSLVANGGLSLDAGPAQALVDALNLPSSSLKKFNRLGGPFTIEDGQFRLNTWDFGGARVEGQLDGALGLSGGVDLDMTLQVPLSVLNNSGLAGRLGGGDGQVGTLLNKLVGGDAGAEAVPVTVRLGGTMRDPSVEVLNKDAITSNIRSLAKEEGLNRLRNLFGGDGGE
ncbi:AsmA-like C-terminal region-containing protein [Salinibacter grassmerensis]|uniref:DUF748 domain-containing protein n=1 Tax=Salinibacter grassmerensis TaxID=3040353 RepID=UPI0021E8EDD0|nr:AsmA-like C-terminal region-containing protein [Salinibacter grassmerensis]